MSKWSVPRQRLEAYADPAWEALMPCSPEEPDSLVVRLAERGERAPDHVRPEAKPSSPLRRWAWLWGERRS